MRSLLSGLLAVAFSYAAVAQVPFEDLNLRGDEFPFSLDASDFYLVVGITNGRGVVQASVYTRSAIGAPWLLDAVLDPSGFPSVCYADQVASSQNRVLVSDPCK